MKIKNNIAISDSGFIFNSNTGESFSVNPIGVEIINFLKKDKSKDEIKKIILEKYQADDATFERDFYDFVSILSHYFLTEQDEEKKN